MDTQNSEIYSNGNYYNEESEFTNSPTKSLCKLKIKIFFNKKN
jgi:hypothetical protein